MPHGSNNRDQAQQGMQCNLNAVLAVIYNEPGTQLWYLLERTDAHCPLFLI